MKEPEERTLHFRCNAIASGVVTVTTVSRVLGIWQILIEALQTRRNSSPPPPFGSTRACPHPQLNCVRSNRSGSSAQPYSQYQGQIFSRYGHGSDLRADGRESHIPEQSWEETGRHLDGNRVRGTLISRRRLNLSESVSLLLLRCECHKLLPLHLDRQQLRLSRRQWFCAMDLAAAKMGSICQP